MCRNSNRQRSCRMRGIWTQNKQTKKATFHEKVNMIDNSEAGIKCLERRVKNRGEVFLGLQN